MGNPVDHFGYFLCITHTQYSLEKVQEYEQYAGRLLIKLSSHPRGRAVNLDTYIRKMVIAELLPEKYTGIEFPGIANINHPFSALKPVFDNERSDWKSSLSSISGIYLITDASNGKQYVGSAYGAGGIWGRWKQYMSTGHGWDQRMVPLVEKWPNYAEKHFVFSILEVCSIYATQEQVIERENYWKEKLYTRKFGYNIN